MTGVSTQPASLERVAALTELAPDTPEIVARPRRRAREHRPDRRAGARGGRRRCGRTRRRTSCRRSRSMQLEAGAVGVQVAKLGEAEVMADAGIDDILVGYPIVGERKLGAPRRPRRARDDHGDRRLRRGRARDLADRARARAHVPGAARARHGHAPPRRPPRARRRRPGGADRGARRARARRRLHARGSRLHAGARRRRAGADDARVLRLGGRDGARRSALAGIPAPVVSVGSAGTFRFAIRCPGVTEVRPGTYVFNDRSQIAQGACGPADLAAFAVATVVARPAPDRIVVDAGSKVLTSDRMLVPDPPASFGCGLGPRRLGRRPPERGARRRLACRRTRTCGSASASRSCRTTSARRSTSRTP